MALVFGKELSKAEVSRHVGDVSQIAGVRQVTLGDGPENHVRALEFRTGSGLEFDVLADRGMDISRCTYKGRSIAWRSSSLDQHPSFTNPAGAEWLRTFQGGLLVTCGLTQVGSPNEDKGEQLGVHGRYSGLSARDVSVTQQWDEDEYLLAASGKVRESRIFGENLSLERTITTWLGANSFRITDTVTNEGFRTWPHMILYHFNIGFPAVAEDSRIYAPSTKCIPRDTAAQTETDQWMTMRPPTKDFTERVYFHDMKADDDGWVTMALVNEKLAGGPFGVWIRYNQKSLPLFTQWKMNGEGDYVCGLEPGNCWPLGRSDWRKDGRLVELEPGQSVDYEIEVGIIDGDEDLKHIVNATGLGTK